MADRITELQEACGYDPDGDTGVDSLIDYKDALEALAAELLAREAWTYVWITCDGPSLGAVYSSQEAATDAAFEEWKSNYGGTLGGYTEGTRGEFDAMYETSGDIWIVALEKGE